MGLILPRRLMSLPASGGIEFVGRRLQIGGGQTFAASVYNTLSEGIASTPEEGDFCLGYAGAASTADMSLYLRDYDNTTWNIIGEYYINSTFDANLIVGWRWYDPAEVSGGIFAEVLAGGTTANAYGVSVLVFRGVDPTTPIDVTPTTASSTSSVLLDPPSITPVTPGAVVVTGGVGAHNDGTDTYSSSDLDYFTTAGADDTNDCTIGVGYKANWTSGAVNPATFTFSGSDSTSFSYAAVSVAIRPAS